MSFHSLIFCRMSVFILLSLGDWILVFKASPNSRLLYDIFKCFSLNDYSSKKNLEVTPNFFLGNVLNAVLSKYIYLIVFT